MVVLITGASGGFGSVLGQILVKAGLTVYGTSRNPGASQPAAPFPVLAMEVTDAASVAGCIAEVVEREGRIDVVVNCVNEMMIGTVEEQTADEVRALYDTNVLGVLRVCQQALPVMRSQGSGLIVNMSSLGGLLAGGPTTNVLVSTLTGSTSPLVFLNADPGDLRNPATAGRRQVYLHVVAGIRFRGVSFRNTDFLGTSLVGSQHRRLLFSSPR